MDTSEIDVIIRPMVKTDVDAVFNLAGRLITPEETESLNLGDPENLCCVADVGGKVVGFNLASELYVGIPPSKICVMQGIVVHDDYRRLGIGEKLMEAVAEYCSNCGVEVIRVMVDENDVRLQQFVERAGFRRSNVVNFDRSVESTR